MKPPRFGRLLVCTLLLMSAAACGPQGSGSDPAAPAPAPPEPAGTVADGAPSDDAVRQAIAPWNGDLDGMVERRYIRMLVTFSKTSYFVDRGEQHGAAYEAGKAFEKFVNARLRTGSLPVHVLFVPVSRDRLFQALVEGRGDVAAAGLTMTPERQKIVDFGVPFVSDIQELVVTSRGQPPISSAEDLSGREIHVRRSSSYYESLASLNARLKAAGREPARIIEASEQLEDEDILELVNAGVIPATVVDSHIAQAWGPVFPAILVHSAAAVRTGGRIAWAVRRGAPRLREAIDAFAAANEKGTLAFNVVYQEYFGSNVWIRNAASESERRKFEQMVALFRKYGDQYQFPYLLLAAQAYQESHIDQSKRSRAGAVGVMQIKPSTAAGDPINITGVDRSAERNIHAGAKYLRFIIDRYYAREPMDRVTKGLFAVASYNAGPARVAGLRRRAEAIGLDPNKWFGNVEVVAAREIGRETVTYVSNIYKYYVTFQLLSEQIEARRKARTRSPETRTTSPWGRSSARSDPLRSSGT